MSMFGVFVPLLRMFYGLRGGWRDPEFRGVAIFVLSLILTGAIFYMEVERWSFLDSLYFSVMTLTTVGYGDFSPKTDLGKIFTILYVLIGVGTILSFLAVLAHHAKEQDPIHQRITANTKEGKEKKD